MEKILFAKREDLLVVWDGLGGRRERSCRVEKISFAQQESSVWYNHGLGWGGRDLRYWGYDVCFWSRVVR